MHTTEQHPIGHQGHAHHGHSHSHADCCAPQASSGAATQHSDAPEQSELNAIQDEIRTKLQSPAKNSLPWGSVAVTAVLGILTLVSIAQMVQSALIYNKLKSGDIKPSNVAAPANDSLQSLPNMVGGC